MDRLELDADDVGGRGGIDEVLARRAVLVVVVILPVLHEQPRHRVAGALEEQRRHRGVHASRHSSHDFHEKAGERISRGYLLPARKSSTHFCTSAPRASAPPPRSRTPRSHPPPTI